MDWYSLIKDLGLFSIGGLILSNLIQKLSLEYQVRFTKLHHERVKRIQNLYEKLIEVVDNLNRYIANHEPEISEELKNNIIELGKYYKNNAVYFQERTCKLIAEFLKNASMAKWENDRLQEKLQEPDSIFYHPVFEKQRLQLSNRVNVRIYETLPVLIKQVEKEFRELLGVQYKKVIQMNLNTTQKWILFAYGLIVLVVFTYVPWLCKNFDGQVIERIGYSLIWNVPKTKPSLVPSIDHMRLFIKFFSLTLFFSILFLISDRVKMSDSKKNKQKKKSNEGHHTIA